MEMVDRILEVLRICIPVFVMIGIGRFLTARGIMTAAHRGFLNMLIYYIALPALIFSALVQQSVAELLNTSLIISTIGATCIVALLYGIFALIRGYKSGFGAVFVFGTFWANVSYIGFPLAMSAFGEARGLAMAAVVNAFAMPAFVILGHMLIGMYASGGEGGIAASVRKGLVNPIVISAVLGLLCAAFVDILPSRLPSWIQTAGDTALSFLELAGDMGLPLALICVGSAVRMQAIRARPLPLTLVILGKLVISPCITLALFSFFFPDALHAARGVAVVLMATPNAVASYVICTTHGIAEDFIASLLVVSTVASMITIPVWLFVVL